jgi:transposase InsO family protein
VEGTGRHVSSGGECVKFLDSSIDEAEDILLNSGSLSSRAAVRNTHENGRFLGGFVQTIEYRTLPARSPILDLCSRFAVGWAMNERITDDLTLDALGMALARRRPPQGLFHHSDRGSQYASGDYQRVLAQHGIVCSMSRRGDCWDNAVAESFFATLKVELVHDAAWATRTAARTELFDYLEVFYNGQRRHSALGYLSPRAFERRREQETVAT